MCKECGGSRLCEHGRERCKCKECGSQVIILEATEVELEFEREAEPDEGLSTVQGYVVVTGPPGGKRKRES